MNSLEQVLQTSIEGRCDFSAAGRALYASDASNYRQIPLGVVIPKNPDDLVNTVNACRHHGVPILMRGGGTSQNGQCVNEAVVVDCSQHLNKVISIDKDTQTALVEPGVVCDQLKAEAEAYGLTWGPDPATHSRCTLGGMIGNNSCGPHSMLAGKTVENVLELEILLNDGTRFWVGPTPDDELDKILAKGDRQSEIYHQLISLRDEYADSIRQRFPGIKRRVSGYNLDQLLPENNFNVARALVGSEGTCVTVLQAKLKLITNPEFTQLVVLGFKDIYAAGDSVPELMPFSPIAMEGIDWTIVGGLNERNRLQEEVALLPEGKAWLMVELAADSENALATLAKDFVHAMNHSDLVTSVLNVPDSAQQNALWRIREQGASATAISLNPEEPDPIVGWEDTAVDPMQLGDYLRAFHALVKRYGYTTSLYGHFGDGCIHARMTFDTRSTEGVKKFRAFSKEIAQLVVQFGGSLSGEHGDGQAKAEFLPIMYGDVLVGAFEKFKQIWDPETQMNPRKLVNAYRMDENLRYGPGYESPVTETRLSFVEDIGGFGRSTERCIGMGKCRASSGAMCPSYQATLDERYSTRGRAHVLHEMVRGEIIEDGWNNEAIAESLEHCLSCKACKTECPTQVDMASYKAEFMHHHYRNKRRPVAHYAFGFVGNVLPKLAKAPRLAQVFQRGPFGLLLKKVLGISIDAKLPVQAKQVFSRWVQENTEQSDEHFNWFGQPANPPAVLWVDTVNEHYRPELLQAAVRVLCKANYRVAIAKEHFCCGRPLYEYGFLEKAKKQLNAILQGFYTKLPEGSQVVVMEPSCLSVFKEEIHRMFPDDTRAKDLSNRALSVSELLIKNQIEPQRTLPSGVLHLHCHDKAAAEESADRVLLQQCFDRLIEPEQSCCGMAGTFGLASRTRHIGKTLYAKRLQAGVEQAEKNTWVVANGFSCSKQMSDLSGKQAYHPIEVMEQCF